MHGKVVVTEYITLDGVMENPEWIGPYFDNDFLKFKYDELFASDALLMGRFTYEYFLPVWLNATAADDAPGQEGFAERVHSLPKYVVSRTINKSEWNNTRFINSNLVEAVTQLKRAPGQDILVAGSGTLIQTLMQNDLVDEYRLLVYPIILGKGKRLFQEGRLTNLKLINLKGFSSGVVSQVYQTDRNGSGQIS